MVDVKVSFDYDAEQPDELTIRVGDIINNVSTPEGGWWEGELNGKKGLFPDNFVEVIKNPEKSKDRDKENDGGDVTGGHRASTKGHVAELANKLRDGVHIGGGPPKKRESLNKKKLKAKANFAYVPENDDELTLEVGDVVEVLKQEEEGWWEGNLNGKIGMFPSNFVDIIDENSEEVEKSDEPKKDDDFQEIKGKKVQGFGFGNIFGGGPIKLKKGAAGKKAGPPETVERKKEEKSESVTMRDKTIEKAVVRFSYAAENEDELNLQVGEVVNVLDKELDDSGWWKGEVNGKSGVFPDNFVELLPQEELKPKKPLPPSVQQSGGSVKSHSKPDRPTTEPTNENSKKKDDHQQSGPPPVIPVKKPPPPVGKKPLPARPFEPVPKTEEHKPKAVSHDKKESAKKSHMMINLRRSGRDHFEGLESTTEKLSHPTANRAKLPNRRPPSQIFLHTEEEKLTDHDKHIKSSIIHKEEIEEKKDESIKDEVKKRLPTINSTPGSITSSTSSKRNSYLANTVKHEESPTVKLSSKFSPSGGIISSPAQSNSFTTSSEVSSEVIDELRREIRDLRANTVSKAAYNDLKSEMDKMKRDLEMIKASFGKKFVDLMNEVDEEKKTRLNTQVEIDRIKRLVTDSSI